MKILGERMYLVDRRHFPPTKYNNITNITNQRNGPKQIYMESNFRGKCPSGGRTMVFQLEAICSTNRFIESHGGGSVECKHEKLGSVQIAGIIWASSYHGNTGPEYRVNGPKFTSYNRS
jgi:hypothetical protein